MFLRTKTFALLLVWQESKIGIFGSKKSDFLEKSDFFFNPKGFKNHLFLQGLCISKD